MVAIVEKFNSFIKRRIDLWGFGDLLHVQGDIVTIVQTTSGDNVSARLKKIDGIPEAQAWLASPNRKIVVHGWRKVGPRGQRKKWECRIVEVERNGI
jgi:hypothetical protein